MARTASRWLLQRAYHLHDEGDGGDAGYCSPAPRAARADSRSCCASSKKLGVERAIVYIPTNSITPEKRSRLEGLGAEVRSEGSWWIEAHHTAVALTEQLNAANPDSAVYIHPFDHPWIVQGQGTVMLEAAKQMDGQNGRPELPEVVVASVGGGGLLTGIIHAYATLPEPKVPRQLLLGARSLYSQLLHAHTE